MRIRDRRLQAQQRADRALARATSDAQRERIAARLAATNKRLDAERDLLAMGDGTPEHRGCQGLLWQLALKYSKKCQILDMDDLVQAGRVALLEAAERFDPATGNRFTTYAQWCVSGQLKLAAKLLTERGIHVPVYYRQRNAQRDESATDRRHQMDEETARLVHAALNPRTLHCLEGGEESAAREQETPDTFEVEHLRWALGRLPPREREVLELCLGEGQTLQHVGERLGVTRERVRQLRIRGLERLRREMGVTECVA